MAELIIQSFKRKRLRKCFFFSEVIIRRVAKNCAFTPAEAWNQDFGAGFYSECATSLSPMSLSKIILLTFISSFIRYLPLTLFFSFFQQFSIIQWVSTPSKLRYHEVEARLLRRQTNHKDVHGFVTRTLQRNDSDHLLLDLAYHHQIQRKQYFTESTNSSKTLRKNESFLVLKEKKYQNLFEYSKFKNLNKKGAEILESPIRCPWYKYWIRPKLCGPKSNEHKITSTLRIFFHKRTNFKSMKQPATFVIIQKK